MTLPTREWHELRDRLDQDDLEMMDIEDEGFVIVPIADMLAYLSKEQSLNTEQRAHTRANNSSLV